MALVNLLPTADISNSPAWTLSTGSDVYALLGDDEEEPPPRAKAKKKPAEPGELEIDDVGNREESVSQDEIDALFG